MLEAMAAEFLIVYLVTSEVAWDHSLVTCRRHVLGGPLGRLHPKRFVSGTSHMDICMVNENHHLRKRLKGCAVSLMLLSAKKKLTQTSLPLYIRIRKAVHTC